MAASSYSVVITVFRALGLALVLHGYSLGYSPLKSALLLLVLELCFAVARFSGQHRSGGTDPGIISLLPVSGPLLGGALLYAGGIVLTLVVLLATGLAAAIRGIGGDAAARTQAVGDETRHTHQRGSHSSQPGGILVTLGQGLLLCASLTCFAVAMPLHLSGAYLWNALEIGLFLSVCLFAYTLTRMNSRRFWEGRTISGSEVTRGLSVAAFPLLLLAFSPAADRFPGLESLHGVPQAELCLVLGSLLFMALLGINRSLQQVLQRDTPGRGLFAAGTTMLGRSLGIVLSGWAYQAQGLVSCLLLACLLIAFAALLTLLAPRQVIYSPNAPRSAHRTNLQKSVEYGPK